MLDYRRSEEEVALGGSDDASGGEESEVPVG